MLSELILRKRGPRSDSIWVSKLLYRDPIRFIAVALDAAILMRSQYWPRERLRRLQLARLRDAVANAQHIPLWEDRFARCELQPETLDGQRFVRLPISTKADFPQGQYQTYTAPRRLGPLLVNRTSGSTGKPLLFYHDGRYELRQYGICRRMLRTASGAAAPVLAIRARVRPGFSLDPRHFFYLRGYNSVSARFPELVEHANSFGEPVILYGFSSALLAVARESARRGIAIPCAAVIASGEGLQNSQRKELRDTLRADVYQCYTTSELGWLGFECEHHRMHLNEESAYVEITDAVGRPLPEGVEGRILVTPFDTFVMPFIRYDTGDTGAIASEQCPCGRTLRTIHVRGRNVEYLTFADNRTISLLDISSAFDKYAHAIQQFQIVQTGGRSIVVRIVQRDAFEEIRDELTGELSYLIHPNLDIDWECVDSIPEGPNGKAVYFIRAESQQT